MRKRKGYALQIEIDKEIGERIEALGGSLPKIADYSAGIVADDMATFIRDTFLKGKALAYRSGRTHKSVQAYKAKFGNQGIYVDFGRGVRGHLNYIHKWTGTNKEFMGPGKAAYEASGKWEKLVEQNLERMQRKLEVI